MPTSPALASVILKAAVESGTVARSTPVSESQMNSPVPPQQFLAGGIGGVVTWLLIWGLHRFANLDLIAIAATFGMDASTLQAVISGLVAAALVYLVPPSKADVIKHLDDEIVHTAMKDPESNVSYVQTPVQPPPGEPAVIIPPATKPII